jgi:hypothetical protein
MCQTVKRADAVPDIGEQSPLVNKPINAIIEIIHGRIDQGDDQDLLVVLQDLAFQQISGKI